MKIYKKNNTNDYVYLNENNEVVATYGNSPSLPINFNLYTLQNGYDSGIKYDADLEWRKKQYNSWIAAGHSEATARLVTGYVGV